MFTYKLQFGGRNILTMSGNNPFVGARAGLGPSPGWGPVRVGAHMGPYGPIYWPIYGPIYKPIWAHVGPFGSMWALMGPPGRSWKKRQLSINFP